VVVEMKYDEGVNLPKDAQAIIIAPSIVGDRYVQIAPVFTGGAKLPDGATLAAEDTSVPLELDQIYTSLNDLNVALGPNGANSKGALTDLLETTAANFGGQGAQFCTSCSPAGCRCSPWAGWLGKEERLAGEGRRCWLGLAGEGGGV
jgi:phospholipid/cholesterol/gamma-HCH transport system substrate-binding protein